MSPDENEDLEKVYTDMYIGNGRDNPSITTRLSMVEDKLERMGKNLNKALWLAVSTIVGLIVELITQHWPK